MTLCPACHSYHYESNLIDERPFVEAAQQAPCLRHYGETDMAVHVLSALSSVRIKNFTRLRWRCLRCGAQFDE